MYHTEEIDLLPGTSGVNSGDERGTVFHSERFLNKVERPTLTTFVPTDRPPSAWVVILPGGGYGGVSLDKEGLDFARLLASWGLAGAVVTYRLPDPTRYLDPPLPLVDVRAALDLVSKKANPGTLIGLAGFSAGGHLAQLAALDTPDARVSFLVLGYPVSSSEPNLVNEGSFRNLCGDADSPALRKRYSFEKRITKDSPAIFCCHANDDQAVPVGNSLALGEACKAAGVTFQLSRHPKGGHGFGLAHGSNPLAPDWAPDLHAFLKARGALHPKA